MPATEIPKLKNFLQARDLSPKEVAQWLTDWILEAKQAAKCIDPISHTIEYIELRSLIDAAELLRQQL